MEPLISIDVGDRAAARKIILEEVRAKCDKLPEQEASAIEGRWAFRSHAVSG
jgi:hypothetical protein